MRFWFWRRKKKESSRETARKRLERLISTSRRREIGIQEIIPEDKLSENSEKIRERIVAGWLKLSTSIGTKLKWNLKRETVM